VGKENNGGGGGSGWGGAEKRGGGCTGKEAAEGVEAEEQREGGERGRWFVSS